MRCQKNRSILFLYVLTALICLTWQGAAFSLQKIVYSDSGLAGGTRIDTWDSFRSASWGFGGADFNGSYTADAGSPPDSVRSFRTATVNATTWAGWGVFKEGGGTFDYSAYEGGFLKFWVKSPLDLKVEIQDAAKHVRRISQHGWTPADADTWIEIRIPLTAFDADLSQLSGLFLITLEESIGVSTNKAFYIDYIRYTDNPQSLAITIEGRQLKIDGTLFTVKGVCYSPTPVGSGYMVFDVAELPDPVTDYDYMRDFRLIKAMGANTIRVYNTPLSINNWDNPDQYIISSEWGDFLEAAADMGLYVIMDYPVPYGADITNNTIRSNLKTGYLNMIGLYMDYRAILMWNLGNEINRNLGGGSSKTQWYQFVNEVAEASHQLENDSRGDYHPVIAAIAENPNAATEINQYDALVPYMDAWAVQLYRGDNFGNIFSQVRDNNYTDKPLILTEFGCDAYDMRYAGTQQAEESGEQNQADYLRSQWEDINNNLSAESAQGICIGGTVFMWSDDWSKSNLGLPNTMHDTTAISPPNYAYYDKDAGNNINEEWWGICGITAETTGRTKRKAYDTLQSLWWPGAWMVDVEVDGAETLAWSGAVAGADVWQVADNPIIISVNEAFLDVIGAWGVQLYSDNTNDAADPQYEGDTTRDFNLVGKTNNASGLALCWKIADNTLDEIDAPVWQKERADGFEGFSDYEWRWMKDRGQKKNIGSAAEPDLVSTFTFGEPYIMAWDQNGIYWKDHVTGPEENDISPAPALSPNYIYVGLRLTDSFSEKYGTNQLIVEFIFP